MIANGSANGHARKEAIERLISLELDYATKRKEREVTSTYAAGEVSRMNPAPRGVDPLGSDADYHYRSESNYFLMVERGREAVRNHPLVEQGINRLAANLRLGEFTLDLDSGDDAFDTDHKDWWNAWCDDAKQCDYEQTRTFSQRARQSFFNEVSDGDIIHLPIIDGCLQTWESHHLRNPWGHRPSDSDQNGIIHGVEVRNGRLAGYWLTPQNLRYFQSLTKRGKSRRFPAFDEDGNRAVFYLGFTHRFFQRRGISRLSAPRDAMNGFDDLNFANIKSSLRRALISYLMEDMPGSAPEPKPPDSRLPQAGDRYSIQHGLGLQSIVVEQQGEPAQVFKVPTGKTMQGWNANLPASSFFEHAALMLQMLAVNLDIPLMFLLLDGSMVNFHGGRMIFDQAKLRFEQLQKDQKEGLWNPTYEWKTRQRMTPGTKFYDPAFAAAVARGRNPFKYQFRAKGWPYVKPLEDAAGEDLAERRNLRSHRGILSARGEDLDEFRDEVIPDRRRWFERALVEARATVKAFPDAELNLKETAMLYAYGTDPSGVQLSMNATEPPPAETAPSKPKERSSGN